MMLSENKVLRTVAMILQVIVAGVFLVAATFKAFDPNGFAEQIREYAILPQYSMLAAWSLIILEYVLAAALLVNLKPRIFTTASIILLVFFIGITAYAMITGVTSNCGCFGNLAHRGPESVIIEDSLMIAALLFSFLVLRTQRQAWKIWKGSIVILFAVIAALLIGWSYQLPVDSIVTQLRVGNSFQSWPTEGLYKNLNEDAHVVFLFSIHEPTIESDVMMMNAIAQQEGVPSAIGLIIDGSDQLTTLMFQYGTSFHVGAIEPRFAKALYRTLPRTFILRSGVVTAVWNGIPGPQEIMNAFSKANLLAGQQ